MELLMSGTAPNYPFSEPKGLVLDPAYARLRREEPITWVKFPYGGEGWLITTYQEAKFVYGDPRFSKALAAGRDVPRMVRTIQPTGAIAAADGADLARLRRLTFHAFTGRRAEELRPRIQEITDDLLDHLDNPGDLVAGFTAPLPQTVICELLGVPLEDRADFRRWTEIITTVDGYTPEETADGMAKLSDYITGLVAQRRATPTDDLLGTLVAARDDGDMLTDQELLIFGMTMLSGGQSPMNQLGSIIATLLDRPEAMAQLREEPELLPGAIEELLRFVPLLTGTGPQRIAAEDVQVADVTVKKGQAILVSLNSANRDESAFEHPDELDLRRETAGQHLAFGHGSHYCPGAQLGRTQLQVGLGTLLRRFPGLQLAEPVEFKKGNVQRGPRKLIVTWRQAPIRDNTAKSARS
ncbi:cytochrome P450 [Amycolatopsis sp. NPDC049868]|uniref:cytochrome P450 n=1 Tax=Amycolatopsis sp. NPDC049868 TaxID=3363934 RepID=UPI0037AA4227